MAGTKIPERSHVYQNHHLDSTRWDGFAARNGRWRGVLTDDDLAMYETAASTLDPNLWQWLEGGRHATKIA